MTGKDLINKFYQPLGYLGCKVSSDVMWSHAKDRALEVADMMLGEHPMYVGELNPKWKKWQDIKDEISTL
jgi:hypothetical protein